MKKETDPKLTVDTEDRLTLVIDELTLLKDSFGLGAYPRPLICDKLTTSLNKIKTATDADNKVTIVVFYFIQDKAENLLLKVSRFRSICLDYDSSTREDLCLSIYDDLVEILEEF